MSDTASSSPSTPSSSCPSIPPSPASSPLILQTNLSRCRKKRKDAIAAYTLRPRSNTHSGPPPTDEKPVHRRKPGRLQDWQNNILQEVFDAGIRTPGDATILLLVLQLKDRTEKQVRDWFSHRRRRLRESGVIQKPTTRDEDIPIVIDSLILSRYECDYSRLARLALIGPDMDQTL